MAPEAKRHDGVPEVTCVSSDVALFRVTRQILELLGGVGQSMTFYGRPAATDDGVPPTNNHHKHIFFVIGQRSCPK